MTEVEEKSHGTCVVFVLRKKLNLILIRTKLWAQDGCDDNDNALFTVESKLWINDPMCIINNDRVSY